MLSNCKRRVRRTVNLYTRRVPYEIVCIMVYTHCTEPAPEPGPGPGRPPGSTVHTARVRDRVRENIMLFCLHVLEIALNEPRGFVVEMIKRRNVVNR